MFQCAAFSLSRTKQEEGMGRDEITAFLGAGTAYEGKLTFNGSVRIDGEFKGEVDSEGTLVVGVDAQVEGQVRIGQLIVSGHITGRILASRKVVLHKQAHLVGSVTTPSLVIEEGAVLEGEVHMEEGTQTRMGELENTQQYLPES